MLTDSNGDTYIYRYIYIYIYIYGNDADNANGKIMQLSKG